MPKELPDVGPDSTRGSRLRAAVMARYPKVKAFTDAKGIAYESFISIMSGKRNLTDEKAQQYSDMLDVPTEWLLNGPAGNGKVFIDTNVDVRFFVSGSFTDITKFRQHHSKMNGHAQSDGHQLNPHLIKRKVDPPMTVPELKREQTFAAYCDGSTDVVLIKGTCLLCSSYPSDTELPFIGFLLAEERHDLIRVLPYFRQYGDIHACPIAPHKGLRLPAQVPTNQRIVGLIHAFWRDAFSDTSE